MDESLHVRVEKAAEGKPAQQPSEPVGSARPSRISPQSTFRLKTERDQRIIWSSLTEN